MSEPHTSFEQKKHCGYAQSKLLANLTDYYASKDPPAKMPFSSEGLCSGLVSFWLYCKRINQEEELFLKNLRYAISWSKEAAIASGQVDDPIIEQFINNIMFLQHDHILRDDARQTTLDKSLAMLLDDSFPRVQPAEHELTFVFNKNTLNLLAKSVFLPNKMIRIDNGLHAQGTIYTGQVYSFYDPNADEGPQDYKDPSLLVNAIFKGLAKYCKSKHFIAVSLHIYDIDKSHQYLNARAYYESLLQNADYREAVITHPNIFHLSMRMQDYQVADLLYANGYQYIPWTLSSSSELEEAVLDRDKVRLAYLISHDVPIDYHNDNGITPIGRAVIAKAHEMLYLLLVANADPNLRPSKYVTMTYLLTQFNNSAALILLLAAGMDLSDSLFALLRQKYSNSDLEAILTHALILHVEKVFPRSISPNVIRLLAESVQALCQTPVYDRTQAQIKEHADLLENLQTICSIDSNIVNLIRPIRNQLAAYLREPPNPKKNLLFTPITSFSEDVAPLLSLELKVKSV